MILTIRFEYPAPINKKIDTWIRQLGEKMEWKFYASGQDMVGDTPVRDICFDVDLTWMFDGEERERKIREKEAISCPEA